MACRLYLIPNFISENKDSRLVPLYIAEIIKDVRFFFVEGEPAAQRFLKKINPQLKDFSGYQFFVLNEHTPLKEAKTFFDKNLDKDMGLISESGVPCVADPGAEVVLWAHRHNIEVVPLIGPSSIFLALSASGLNGQNFAFSGYLPKEKEERAKKIRELEKRSAAEKQTQIFMETPYRNESLFKELLEICHPDALLCAAIDLTGQDQEIKTLPVSAWRKANFAWKKKPALFLLLKNK